MKDLFSNLLTTITVAFLDAIYGWPYATEPINNWNDVSEIETSNKMLGVHLRVHS